MIKLYCEACKQVKKLERYWHANRQNYRDLCLACSPHKTKRIYLGYDDHAGKVHAYIDADKIIQKITGTKSEENFIEFVFENETSCVIFQVGKLFPVKE